MYCNDCGTELIKGSKFCNVCGASVPDESSPFGFSDSFKFEPSGFSLDPEPVTKKSKSKAKKSKSSGNNSSKKTVILIASCAAAAVIAALIAFNFGYIQHFFMRTFMSEEDYYAHIESRELNEIVDIAADSISAYDLNSFTEGKNIDFSLESEIGSRGKDILSFADAFGIDTSWIKNAGVSGSIAAADNNAALSIAAGLNNEKKMLSADVIFDGTNGDVYARMPEINKEYALINSGNTSGISYLVDNNMLPEKGDLDINYREIAKIAKTCTNVIPSNASTVKEGKEKLVINDIKQKVHTYTATYTYKDVNLAIIDARKKLLKDKNFKNYICNTFYKDWENYNPVLNVTIPMLAELTGTNSLYSLNPLYGNISITPADERYTTLAPYLEAENAKDFYEALIDEMSVSIDESEYNLKNNASSYSSPYIITKVYVNNKGKLVGRDITQGRTEISVKMPMKGTKFGFHMRADMGGDAVATVSGSGRKIAGKVNGDFEVSADGVHAIDLVVKNFNWNAAKKGSLIGKFTLKPSGQIANIASSAFSRKTNISLATLIDPNLLSISLDLNNKPDDIDTKLLIGEGKDNIITLTAKAKGSKGKVAIPSDAINVTTKDGILTYIESCEINKILEALSGAGVPLQYTDLLSKLIDSNLSKLFY